MPEPDVALAAARAYCRDKASPPGSALHYSLLLAGAAQREALAALHALALALREATEEVADAGVARSKLAWWAEELAGTAAGRPRHPVTRLLAAPLAHAGIGESRLLGVLAALDAHLACPGYADLAALEAHYERSGELLGAMASEICGYHSAATPAQARRLGLGLELAELARRPARRAGGARWTDVPIELVRECGLERAHLDAPRTSTALAAVVRTLAERAALHLGEVLREWPTQDRPRQASRLALAEMTLAHLRALERARYRVLERQPAATPLRKLWVAWKYWPRS